jgi:hypothetical protein
VTEARARVINIYATLAYTPGWANGGQGRGVSPTHPRDWYDKVFFYELVDDPTIAEKWGILHADLTPKPAYDTYRRYIASHATAVGPCSKGPGPLAHVEDL